MWKLLRNPHVEGLLNIYVKERKRKREGEGDREGRRGGKKTMAIHMLIILEKCKISKVVYLYIMLQKY